MCFVTAAFQSVFLLINFCYCNTVTKSLVKSNLKTPVIFPFLILAETNVHADLMNEGPEGLLELSCNGHIEEEQQQQCQWRDEDQHNGNADPTEKCASQEQQYKESLDYSMCNGVDSANLHELDTVTEGRGAHSSGVTERHLPAGLEEGELEQSILQEEGEEGDDESDCQYRNQESLRNGQSILWFV